MDIKFQSAVIFVSDIKKSRYFYETLLNQKVMMDFGPCIAFETGLSLWQIDHATNIIKGQTEKTENKIGHDNFELCYETEEIEAISARLSEAGIQYVHPIQEQPWGQRVIRVYDPDGHIIEFGEPMSLVIIRYYKQGMDVDEISQRTSMPSNVVKEVVNTFKMNNKK